MYEGRQMNVSVTEAKVYLQKVCLQLKSYLVIIIVIISQ